VYLLQSKDLLKIPHAFFALVVLHRVSIAIKGVSSITTRISSCALCVTVHLLQSKDLLTIHRFSQKAGRGGLFGAVLPLFRSAFFARASAAPSPPEALSHRAFVERRNVRVSAPSGPWQGLGPGAGHKIFVLKKKDLLDFELTSGGTVLPERPMGS